MVSEQRSTEEGGPGQLFDSFVIRTHHLPQSQSQDDPLELEELMKYCLVPVPPSLGTQDGFFSKTNKASFLHYLLEDTTPGNLPYPKDALFIQDGHCFMFLPTFRQPVVKYVYRYLIRWRPRSTSCSQLTVIIQNP